MRYNEIIDNLTYLAEHVTTEGELDAIQNLINLFKELAPFPRAREWHNGKFISHAVCPTCGAAINNIDNTINRYKKFLNKSTCCSICMRSDCRRNCVQSGRQMGK